MHPLRLLLVISIGIAAAVAAAFGALLARVGVTKTESIVLAAVVFGIFMLPAASTFFWAVRRASDLDLLIERTRKAAEGAYDVPIAERVFHGELDELARSIEELRTTIVREHSTQEEHRGAMQQIVSGLGEGLLAVSPKGRVVFANDLVADMFGDPGTLPGKRVIEVVRKRPLVAALEQALNGTPSTQRVTAGVGEAERQIEIRAFPVRSSSEIAAVALFIDVTEIERLQRIRRDFVDDFSHEIRTPLAGLRTATETLASRRVSPEDEEALRQVMLRQLGRIERLIRDLAELHHIESGQLVLERSEVSLLGVLNELVDDFGKREDANGVKFLVEGEDVPAVVDTLRLQQVFSNLLDNAAKHGGQGGEVTVMVRREAEQAVVQVSDRGAGIPPHEVDRIFNRFYRVDRSRSQAVPGLGLGLAIARHLVLLHGGTIRAFNRAGGGATFEVRLPAS